MILMATQDRTVRGSEWIVASKLSSNRLHPKVKDFSLRTLAVTLNASIHSLPRTFPTVRDRFADDGSVGGPQA
jgi:hypothetical protein